MRHQGKISSEEHNRWLKLETTIGKNQTEIDANEHSLGNFLKGFDNLQKREFQELTGISINSEFTFKITDSTTLRLLLIKKFMDGIGLDIIKEARPGIGVLEEDIYLALLEDLFKNNSYPEDVFAHAMYRHRGSPISWLSIKGEIAPNEARQMLIDNLPKVINSVSWRMKATRKLVLHSDVDELTLILISKPTLSKVVRAESKNVEVSGASYTIIVLDKDHHRIGIVSGSKKEISAIYSVLRNKIYKDGLAPTRSDIEVKGAEVLKKLVTDNNDDDLSLQTLELKKSDLPSNPSIKLKVQGDANLDHALETTSIISEDVSISDLKLAEFLFMGKKKVGIYTFGDEWQRVWMNTATKRITSLLEASFLQQVRERLGGIDIKTTRLLLDDLTTTFIVEKLLKDKRISVNPPIPSKAEHILVDLVKKRLLSKQQLSTKRICWSCYQVSWNQWQCPSCDRSDMRILGEEMNIAVQQPVLIKALSAVSFDEMYDVKFFRSKQRNRYPKPVLELFNKAKGITTHIVLTEINKDITYIRSLSGEGNGVVAIVDPKLSSKIDAIKNSGASVVSLSDIIVNLLENTTQESIKDMVVDQEQQVLDRIYENARQSLNALKTKDENYDERKFEVDIKNIIQAIVPDVEWLGAKSSGTSVPDGYCRYGLRSKRLLGWDAKYSATGRYKLTASDVSKQKKYIDWLLDSSGVPRKLAKLGIYAIISNFDNPKKLKKAVEFVAAYENLPNDARVAIIEDDLLVLVCEWMIEQWKQVIDNNSLIADVLFKWFRRKQSTSYTISSKKDWVYLKRSLDNILQR